ncbi:adenine phosphoribosyltransferase [Leekyejoonella antrihumi]|uniref:Adenine phosphoribosyltransferase n=1 Tax=Leekyejoonella antrihumi TaxID=1660198 RepID=A0A563E347_9MICO|nr:adenine phosphoribosyltransferase [Leekyejoonella antrihumi]TWP36673.1 adenine phosphoribosyltransferase [Leekyejoonella antrihumi]
MTVRDTLLAHVRDVPDFPSPGVLFKDLTPLFTSAAAFAEVTRDIAERNRGRVDVVAGIEARGFIVAVPVALALGVGFIPVRKAGKLPGDVLSRSYALEYGEATIEVQANAFGAGQRVLLVDDVLATGGTAAAACELVEATGATVAGIEMLLELTFLNGRSRLTDRPIRSMARV